ncbi:MAG: AzlC family ABC transporter permease [Aggregatilineales bacterium]
MSSPRAEFWAGVRAELPILLGVIPFGLIYGVLTHSIGLPPLLALAMSSIIFAGSAQFVAAQLIGAGAPGLIIVLTIAVVNVRHVLYSASIAPYVKPLRRAWRFVLAYLLTDEAYAVAIARYTRPSEQPDPSPNRHWYFLGAGLALWSTWQISSTVGIVVGAQVPDSWALDFALPLTFIALVVPALKDRPAIGAAVAAGIVAVLAYGLPYKLGLMLSAVVGLGTGLWLESRADVRRAASPVPNVQTIEE